ncbi:MAG: glycine betaine/L-proline ABC transporter ATP-binding protein [Gammaproteobacteria bacterium]|nr:glycine betaine/L-proline ABC transporter ATP-binding protein [Gammaproteobacteria bacterium]MDH3468779.1 glycine betaine/L-proline ABC transporter ATP-binding protein [Gammaproteobacteria bacterium]
MSDPILTCKNVWKLYGASPREFFAQHNCDPNLESIVNNNYISAVRDASLSVEAGEILVIMGLSGSGKSTLVRCLSRLIEPTGGEIWFEGIDLLKASAKEMIELRRHKMGMVFQHFALLPHRTVLQNVAFPLEVQGIEKTQRNRRAAEMTELVGLKGREDYYPRELSGGQQQRVGIARSLAVEPDLWFLDEPFSALDPLIRREMQDEFLRLQTMLKKTIVFITHDFDEAIRLADRIAIMNEGLIVQLGTAEQLITNPATEYVAEFTKDIPREKLLTVESVMGAPNDATNDQYTVNCRDRIASVAHRVLSSDQPVRVVGSDGANVGSLTRQDIIDILFQGTV